METLPPTTCPNCCAVRKSQGFNVVVDETQPLCPDCLKSKQDRDFYNSPAYQAWIASIPTGLTMEQNTEWVKTNPPPEQTS